MEIRVAWYIWCHLFKFLISWRRMLADYSCTWPICSTVQGLVCPIKDFIIVCMSRSTNPWCISIQTVNKTFSCCMYLTCACALMSCHRIAFCLWTPSATMVLYSIGWDFGFTGSKACIRCKTRDDTALDNGMTHRLYYNIKIVIIELSLVMCSMHTAQLYWT